MTFSRDKIIITSYEPFIKVRSRMLSSTQLTSEYTVLAEVIATLKTILLSGRTREGLNIY